MVDSDGRTPIFFTYWEGDEGIVSLLMERGADINQGKSSDRWTQLVRAIASRSVECVRCLVTPKRIKLDARDGEGQTALFFIAVMKVTPKSPSFCL